MLGELVAKHRLVPEKWLEIYERMISSQPFSGIKWVFIHGKDCYFKKHNCHIGIEFMDTLI